jgi:hypothetical protein
VIFFFHNITQNRAQQQKSTQFVSSHITNSQQSCHRTMHAGQNSSGSFVIRSNGTSTAGDAEAMPNSIMEESHCKCSEFFHSQYHAKLWATTKIASVRFIISHQQSTIRSSDCTSGQSFSCCVVIRLYGTSTTVHAELTTNSVTVIMHCKCSELFYSQYCAKLCATTEITKVCFIISLEQSPNRICDCS